MRSILLALAISACTPIAGTAYQAHYVVPPRTILVNALDVARENGYSAVAIESADVFHNSMLVFRDGSPTKAPTALLISVAIPPKRLDAPTQGSAPGGTVGSVSTAPGTKVAVTPMAFENGHALAESQVPAETKADAQRVMYAIYDRSRDFREPRLLK
ncbi:MAG: hypothetical protein ACM31C_32395 [Acidobacteriota bacterium]